MRLGVGPVATWILEDSVASLAELVGDTEVTSELPTVVVTGEAAQDAVGGVLDFGHGC